MELAVAGAEREREIDEVGNNKNWRTFFQEPGGDRIRVRLFVGTTVFVSFIESNSQRLNNNSRKQTQNKHKKQ